MSDQQFILQLPQQTTASTSTASDSSYSLQVKNIEIVERPRLEHLKFFVLGKLQPYQFPIIIVLILLSLFIIFHRIKRRKYKIPNHKSQNL